MQGALKNDLLYCQNFKCVSEPLGHEGSRLLNFKHVAPSKGTILRVPERGTPKAQAIRARDFGPGRHRKKLYRNKDSGGGEIKIGDP